VGSPWGREGPDILQARLVRGTVRLVLGTPHLEVMAIKGTSLETGQEGISPDRVAVGTAVERNNKCQVLNKEIKRCHTLNNIH